MTVLSVLRCGGNAAATGSPSTAVAIRFIGLGNSGNLAQLIRQNGGLILRRCGSSGGARPSGIRVAEFIKNNQFRDFKISPSRYPWQKYKDMFHFYFMLGFIPCIIGVFLVNVFIGPPTLAIAEPGYEPKHWEYHRHPITRFMARYLMPSYQETYERNLFYIQEEEEKRKMRLLAWRAEALQRERGDFYGSWGTKTNLPAYYRHAQEGNKRTRDGMGDVIADEDVVGLPFDK